MPGASPLYSRTYPHFSAQGFVNSGRVSDSAAGAGAARKDAERPCTRAWPGL